MRLPTRLPTVREASTAGLVLIAALSFALSYGNLHTFAERFGVNGFLGWLWPVIVDAAIVVGTILVMSDRVTNWSRSFLIAATGVSVFGNGWTGWANGVIGVGAHIVPPLFLLAVTHIVAAELHKAATVNTPAEPAVNTPAKTAPAPSVNTPQPAPAKPPAPVVKATNFRIVKPAATREEYTAIAREHLTRERDTDPAFTPSVSWVKTTTGCSQGTAAKIANELKSDLEREGMNDALAATSA